MNRGNSGKSHRRRRQVPSVPRVPGIPRFTGRGEITMYASIAVRVENPLKTFGGKENLWLTPKGNGHRPIPAGAKVAVDHVSLDIRRGEIFGVLGPNGSGKSTLIRLIATLLIPDGGRITVFGHDVLEEARVVQALINRVSVEASFFKKLSPMENLQYGARLYGVSAGETKRRVLEILTRLGLDRKTIYRPMEEMSRGLQQKVAIARAFLSEPRLLLLDEPTTGLDPRSKREVQAFVRELRDRHGTTILLTTHDMNQAEALCDRIAIIDGGKIVALDTPNELRKLIPQNGRVPTLEDVFLELTGKELVAEDEK